MIDPDRIVLNCYRLAKYYHIDPRVFLDQSISEVGRHLTWTSKLAQQIADEQEAAQDSE